MDWIIIPARQNSKGLPGKNRKLFSFTADQIPFLYKDKTIVTTDDTFILSQALSYGFLAYYRKESLCQDNSNIKDVLLDVIENSYPEISKRDIITMLYLTYPERRWNQVIKTYRFFKDNHANSLLCREEKTQEEIHPYRWFYDNKNGTGTQIVKHNLYRRQDYPLMFKVNHFIFMAYANEIKKLNKNLWNKNTIFYPIDIPIDIDNIKDYEAFQRGIR